MIPSIGEINNYVLMSDFLPITEVVSGGAAGVDRAGEDWAEMAGIPVRRFLPDWTQYGNRAGPLRNREMGMYADALILVWDGESKGSRSMQKIAKELGLRRFEILISHGERG